MQVLWTTECLSIEACVCVALLCGSEALGLCPRFLHPSYLTQKARYHAKTLRPIYAYWLDSSTSKVHASQLSRALLCKTPGYHCWKSDTTSNSSVQTCVLLQKRVDPLVGLKCTAIRRQHGDAIGKKTGSFIGTTFSRFRTWQRRVTCSLARHYLIIF